MTAQIIQFPVRRLKTVEEISNFIKELDVVEPKPKPAALQSMVRITAENLRKLRRNSR
jgi:hypothetical protein